MIADKNITVASGDSRVPKHLRITPTMWEDFVCDPVLAAWVTMGVKLDAFQACRLRFMWWTQNVIDSSGVGSGKTITDFVFITLRCLLLPDHRAAIFYPSFGTGKQEFWEYFGQMVASERAKIFAAQMGNPLKSEPGDEIDGDGTLHGSECYTAFFRSGNTLKMPAPSIFRNAVNAASLSVNTLIIEEWAQIDAMSDAIDKQLTDRCRRASWNQHHPIWGNHIVMTAHAQTRLHPAAPRYNAHERRVKAGDPTYANIAFSYKDFSDLPSSQPGKTFKERHRNEMSVKAKLTSGSDASARLGQLYGIWGISGTGWFSEEMITAGVASARSRNVLPVLSRAQWEELQRGNN